ncbi:MAG: hypothetical protein I8H77_03575 [Comamonadaceae bacterium]|nr:hypothetical protein [Comamonadaceae bacterium]
MDLIPVGMFPLIGPVLLIALGGTAVLTSALLAERVARSEKNPALS